MVEWASGASERTFNQSAANRWNEPLADIDIVRSEWRLRARLRPMLRGASMDTSCAKLPSGQFNEGRLAYFCGCELFPEPATGRVFLQERCWMTVLRTKWSFVFYTSLTQHRFELPAFISLPCRSHRRCGHLTCILCCLKFDESWPCNEMANQDANLRQFVEKT
jgi:hypothetical protein